MKIKTLRWNLDGQNCLELPARCSMVVDYTFTPRRLSNHSAKIGFQSEQVDCGTDCCCARCCKCCRCHVDLLKISGCHFVDTFSTDVLMVNCCIVNSQDICFTLQSPIEFACQSYLLPFLIKFHIVIYKLKVDPRTTEQLSN